mgnify:CR=1 FL=1
MRKVAFLRFAVILPLMLSGTACSDDDNDVAGSRGSLGIINLDAPSFAQSGVEFGVDAYPGEKFTGKVRQVRLQPVVEQNVVSYVTVVDVPNPELKLKPGMTATVTVEIARADDALRVPSSALRFRPTPEVFTALGQPVPPERGPGGARAGRGFCRAR